MTAVVQALRYGAPVAYAAFLIVAPTLGPVNIAPVRGFVGIVLLVLMTMALIVWPRLWAIAIGAFGHRAAIGFGAVDWTGWLEGLAAGLVLIPLLIVGVGAEVMWIRRKWGKAAPAPQGSPNELWALLAFFVALPLVLRDQYGALTGLAVALALYRLVTAVRDGRMADRGITWIVFLLAGGLMAAYCYYWSRPDLTWGWALARKCGLAVAVLSWGVMRAVVPQQAAGTGQAELATGEGAVGQAA